MPAPITLVPLAGLSDPHLLSWMELYELSFPPSERLLIASMLALAAEQAQGGPRNEWLLSALADDGFVGLVHYATFPERRLAGLWGLATKPGLRGRGLGAEIYAALRARSAAEGCDALIFEVERPDLAETDEARQFAERRIGFYTRLGARLLTGIEYWQWVGPHQPPVSMRVMVHPVAERAPEQGFAWAKALFGDALRQVGALGWE
jgi:GNAT superfamily N-acetyltransferase